MVVSVMCDGALKPEAVSERHQLLEKLETNRRVFFVTN